MSKYLIGIDIGGTFTDIVIFDKENNNFKVIKVPSTPDMPENAVIETLKSLEIKREDILILNHSSTIATNALLTHSILPKTALITNKGFKDILEIGRQKRAEIYNLDFFRPEPLIPRKYRYTLKGRINAKGIEIEKIDEKELEKIKRSLKKEKIETIAVSLLNSYINPVQEIFIKNYLKEFKDKIFISSEIDPQYREYERTSTTVVNAILFPIISSYLNNLKDGLNELGIKSPFYIMNSNGGLNTISYATKRPISIIESGPSAGVIASAFMAKKLSIENLITFDMGGTTAKAGTVIKNRPDISYEFEAAGKTHSGRSIKGSGYVVRYPFIDLAEVSAGGGTIAWIDDANILRVGPKSAGAIPGPASYNKGGEDPTVSDANIILGRLNQNFLLGGKMKIYPELSKKAIDEKIGKILKMKTDEIANGIIRIINNSMAKAISIVSIERGRDPRDFSMIAFGGAGPVHACDIADEMNIGEIIIPEHPGLFSAYGLLTVDITRIFNSSVFEKDIDHVFSNLKKMAIESMKKENFQHIKLKNYIDVRYAGQSFEITLEYKKGMNVKDTFDFEHKKIYGFSSNDPVEIVNAKILASAKIPKIDFPKVKKKHKEIEKTYRDVYFSDNYIKTEVFYRENLSPGDSGRGPAIIEGYDSTIVVNWNWKWETDEYLNIILRR